MKLKVQIGVWVIANTLGGGALLLGQEMRSHPHVQPPPATAVLCGNEIVGGQKKLALFETMQSQGCEDIHFIHVGDGFYLGYGTMVIVGER